MDGRADRIIVRMATSSGIRSHRDLIVWQRAMDLAQEVSRVTRSPSFADRSLKEQLRRSSASVPANIAEGAGRMHRGDYLRFISIARGSAMETATLLELAVRTGSLMPRDTQRAESLLSETLRMLTALAKALARPLRSAR